MSMANPYLKTRKLKRKSFSCGPTGAGVLPLLGHEVASSAPPALPTPSTLAAADRCTGRQMPWCLGLLGGATEMQLALESRDELSNFGLASSSRKSFEEPRA